MFIIILLIRGFAYSIAGFELSQDETMHSRVDVEAFQAALNRDIGGDASTSQLSGSDSGVHPFYSLFSPFPSVSHSAHICFLCCISSHCVQIYGFLSKCLSLLFMELSK